MIHFHTDAWPLLLSTFGNGTTDAEFEAYFAMFDAAVRERRQRFVSLVDGSRCSTPPTAKQRKLIADWQNRKGDSAHYSLGAALVVDNVLVRGALTALSWVAPQAVPMTTVATYDEALSWCIARLEADGQSTSHIRPALRRVRR